MSTTYLGGQALEMLEAAQRVLDAHPRARSGYCIGCSSWDTCDAYEHASAVFARYHQLPRRIPGRTRISEKSEAPSQRSMFNRPTQP